MAADQNIGETQHEFNLPLRLCPPHFTEKWLSITSLYAYSIGLGGSYGHKFKSLDHHELVHFDEFLVKDGVRGGIVRAMYWLWVDGRDYAEVITDSINHLRWLQIKRTVKLNMNSSCPKRGEAGYDPAYKFDFIYKTLVHNVECISKHAESDQCGDETTWGHGGFG